MRTVIFGNVIENKHEVITHCTSSKDGRSIYSAKPELKTTPEIKEWREIVSYDGEPHYNKGVSKWGAGTWNTGYLNISENESVAIEREVFRADLNEYHLYSDKVLEKIEIDKELMDEKFDDEIMMFNAIMITSNDKLKAYCDLHKLYYDETDCIELFKLVYGDDYYYEIKDGKMVAHKEDRVTLSNAYAYSSCNGSTLCGAITSVLD